MCAVLGGIVAILHIDFLPPRRRWSKKDGGTGFNVAVALKRLYYVYVDTRDGYGGASVLLRAFGGG